MYIPMYKKKIIFHAENRKEFWNLLYYLVLNHLIVSQTKSYLVTFIE